MALLAAAGSGCSVTLASLLAVAAGVDSADNEGYTALHEAAGQLDTGAVRAALFSRPGLSPDATVSGRQVAQLLAAGADPQARAGSGGCQPLHLCVAVRRPVLDLVAAGRTVELLLGAGADPVRPVPNRSRKRSRSAAADFY